ncbi:MAG TPA: hypothetical protein VIM36_01520, partial [Gemmatimonadaceae bacterium]
MIVPQDNLAEISARGWRDILLERESTSAGVEPDDCKDGTSTPETVVSQVLPDDLSSGLHLWSGGDRVRLARVIRATWGLLL